MRKSKPSRTVYLLLIFSILMVIGLVFSGITQMDGFYVNGLKINMPIELVVFNAFMLGFLMSMFSDLFKGFFRKIRF